MIDLKLPQSPNKRIIFFALGIIVILAFLFSQSSLSQKGKTLPISLKEKGISASRNFVEAPMVSDWAGGGDKNSYEANGIVSESIMPPIPPMTPPSGDVKIIKSASLNLLVKDVHAAADAITAIRISVGGQPGNASFSEYTSGERFGNITIWVPSEKFDEALSHVKKVALLVENENISVSDVSDQFVDLEARLRNLRASEDQYLEIMKRSGKIPDVVMVARELSTTRDQIEQIQGQLNSLKQRVALSSITVSLSEEAHPITVKDEWRPLTIIKEASRQALRDLTQFVNMLLVLLIQLPVQLIYFAFWVLLIWLFAKLVIYGVRRVKDKGIL